MRGRHRSLGSCSRIARENVSAAGFDDRIVLREQAGEQLTDVDAFDLAWIASAFIPGPTIVPLLHRVHCALRPGAWLLFPMIRAGDDHLTAALARTRVAMFGGASMSTVEIGALLRDEGFGEVETVSNGMMAMVVARVIA